MEAEYNPENVLEKELPVLHAVDRVLPETNNNKENQESLENGTDDEESSSNSDNDNDVEKISTDEDKIAELENNGDDQLEEVLTADNLFSVVEALQDRVKELEDTQENHLKFVKVIQKKHNPSSVWIRYKLDVETNNNNNTKENQSLGSKKITKVKNQSPKNRKKNNPIRRGKHMAADIKSLVKSVSKKYHQNSMGRLRGAMKKWKRILEKKETEGNISEE